MHTRKIVGWSMRETLHATTALEALDIAAFNTPPMSIAKPFPMRE